MIGNIFKTILVMPILNLMVLSYNIVPDIGVVIIAITVIVRLLLLPSFHKSLKSQSSLNELQPKINDLREKHKDDKQAQAQALMALYKEHKVNPFSSCLPLLIQLPLLIALYQVFMIGLKHGDLNTYLYGFVHNPGKINPYFLHLVDLSKPSWIFGVVAGATQYFQSKMMLPKQKSTDQFANTMSMQTLYILPVFSVIISLSLPAGLPLYWIVTTLFAIGQQYYIMRRNNPAVGLKV